MSNPSVTGSIPVRETNTECFFFQVLIRDTLHDPYAILSETMSSVNININIITIITMVSLRPPNPQFGGIETIRYPQLQLLD